MAIFAIGDLHLSTGTDKPMDVFYGWDGYVEKIVESWREQIAPTDTVVLAGDISWGMSLDEALGDFRLIDSLPGKKVLLKGNHDYWWSSRKKMEEFFAAHGLDSLSILHNSCVCADGLALAGQYEIENITIDLTDARAAVLAACDGKSEISDTAASNIAPRLRMTTLYAIGQTKGYLVAGTGNACEYYMGYFTKWGDGAYDLNPIADLTVTEIYEFLRYLKAPVNIIEKAPSAGLFEGQTDEQEMGVTYAQIEAVMENGTCGDAEADAIIARYHSRSGHKRVPVNRYGG